MPEISHSPLLPYEVLACGLFLAFIAIVLGKKSLGLLLFLLACGAALALLRIDTALKEIATHSLGEFARNEHVVIEGWIDEAPEILPIGIEYHIHAKRAAWKGEEMKEVRGRFQVLDYGAWPRRAVGEFVRVSGKLSVPEPQPEFEYAKYLLSQKIDAVMSRGRVESATSDETPLFIRFSPLKILVPVRDWFEGRIRRVLPEPEASLLDGLLIGSTSGLSKEITEEFRRAGLSHIVAVSGTNVTIILAVVSSCLFFLPIKKRFFPMLFATIGFVLLTGASAAVVRAGLMGILGLLALQAERQTMPRLSILWTAFAMTLSNPFALWYDPGFQLSFLAIFGISELGKPLMRVLRFAPETLGIRESIATTLAAQIATLPISIFVFRQWSAIAPFSNLLIAPLIPIAMLCGFLSTMLGVLFLPFGLLFGYPTWAILRLMLAIAHTSASIPGASLTF